MIRRASAARATWQPTYFSLTLRRRQSGTSIDVQGRISKAGDPEVRRALNEAASAMLTRYKGQTALKSWGQIARRCYKKAVVAMACKLAVIMHAMWRDGIEFRFGAPPVRHARGVAAAA